MFGTNFSEIEDQVCTYILSLPKAAACKKERKTKGLVPATPCRRWPSQLRLQPFYLYNRFKRFIP